MMNAPEMKVDIGGLVLKNPVMTASGTFGYGEEYSDYIDLNRLGAIVVKGLSLEPRAGNPPPRIMETSCGMLNSVGLQNIGIRAFISEKLPFLRNFDVAVVANIFGETVEEYVKVAEILNDTEGVDGIEVNISCPNVKKGGIMFGTDVNAASNVISCVRRATSLPLIVKLTPNTSDITVIAKVAEDEGADALSLINTLTGMSVDIKTKTPHLKNVTGGLSGPAVKPVALRMVWETAKSVSIPVIGIGGIMNASDALEFLITGATAVQIGTANFVNPCATTDVLEGIENYMTDRKIRNIRDLIGTLKV
jgi:dihydroorotate dehydrogenase (NAD+) catalytic subunit